MQPFQTLKVVTEQIKMLKLSTYSVKRINQDSNLFPITHLLPLSAHGFCNDCEHQKDF